jgi:hypothetical protein
MVRVWGLGQELDHVEIMIPGRNRSLFKGVFKTRAEACGFDLLIKRRSDSGDELEGQCQACGADTVIGLDRDSGQSS